MTEHQFWARPTTTPPRATILFVPPLFEEANRTRRTIILAMRALADKGFTALLPDLPGQNDSLIATEVVDLATWRAALAVIVAAIDGPVIIASIRGGCLIDDLTRPLVRWRLAPVGGASLLRTLLRARVAADREAGIASTIESLQASAAQTPVLLAGNLLSPAMIAQLSTAEPAPAEPLRTVTLGSGAGAIPGNPLWLRAEPGENAGMATAIAADIAQWSATCGVI